ncbi:GNAT family N-acetyltransferase [Escherichia fergusonii]|uniref:GNAT family N-acetyltransferase n=1 Tax=Escherichia fergusonii TaxID=564 RepID=A0A7W3ETE4_ESCFE|nr:GNAT family N-acetyltransferase [Escherichia fergusonii]EHG6163365.1 GNAT family N-acetyltransferase [Escherichia fergusonii]EHG7564407.1 GNAT family N-acetyltransferase [Escherichia fergusonii]MBA8233030.1 GNAT family N-acetyltransferase [Escherichia fergusonii]MBA8245834.1 GNAT family N-acetyltransferase [Escherichia fergusonii]MCP9676616.1 GNAT family N-acetyltransferase [Escherichia fergusonii]
MFTIKTDDLSHPAVQALVAYHISGMLEQSPPESSHALDVQKLQDPAVTFWSAWEGEQLAGIGALKLLNDKHGELKSMRTAPDFLRRGVANLILGHILQVARDRSLHHLSLETGTHAGFTACHQLYIKHGFIDCEPFAAYQPDPNSRFMSLNLCKNNELL